MLLCPLACRDYQAPTAFTIPRKYFHYTSTRLGMSVDVAWQDCGDIVIGFQYYQIRLRYIDILEVWLEY
jgi:hypothetical protein